MSKNQPDKAQLTIASEKRLSPDMLGVDLRVKVLDQAKKPINGQPFKVHVDGEVLVQGATDENGEYNGQRVLTVQEGTQRKVFLVLEDSPATDWKVIGTQKQEETALVRVTPSLPAIFVEATKGTRIVRRGERLILGKEVHTITEDIEVEEGGILFIEPGSILEFPKNTGIVCKGTMTAVGTKEEPILFRSASNERWENITLLGPFTRNSRLEYCVIEGGGGRYVSNGTDQESVRVLPYLKAKDAMLLGGGLLLLSTDLGGDKGEEDEGIVLSKLAVRNNKSSQGGGVTCVGSSPVFKDCSIDANHAEEGGGLSLRNSQASVRACCISGNKAAHGGGIHIVNSEVIVDSSKISNESGNTGGGIAITEGSSVQITNSDMSANTSTYGAAIHLKQSKLSVTHSKFHSNVANDGVISGKSSQIEILNTKISGNAAVKNIIRAVKSDLVIKDSEMVHNKYDHGSYYLISDDLKGGRDRL